MPRLPATFFGWKTDSSNLVANIRHRAARANLTSEGLAASERGTGADKGPSKSSRSCTQARAQAIEREYLDELVRQCQAAESRPFLQPLSTVLAKLCCTSLPSSARPCIDKVMRLVNFADSLPQCLELAFRAHHGDECVRLFFTNAEHLLTATYGSMSPDAKDMLQRSKEQFLRNCEEAWKHYVFLIFLDLKGDSVLVENIIPQLQVLFGCSTKSLVEALAKTTQWAEKTLARIARKELKSILEQRLAEALLGWKAAWVQRCAALPEQFRCAESREAGHEFWDTYFAQNLRVTWADFAEAFQDNFIIGRCPHDVLVQLRSRVDPGCDEHVARCKWQRLQDQYERLSQLVEDLCGEVVQDAGSRIFRATEAWPASAGPASPRATALEPMKVTPSSSSSCSMEARPRSYQVGSMSTGQVTGCRGEKELQPCDNTTPPDRLQRQMPWMGANGTRIDVLKWDQLTSHLRNQSRPWWCSKALTAEEEALRLSAASVVDGNLALTRRALVLRVLSGSLSESQPALETRCLDDEEATDHAGSLASEPPLPAVVVLANGTRFNGVTRFGRGSGRGAMRPDCNMREPIASRSHFSLVHDRQADRYALMDAGSKWGTFVRIGPDEPLSCGDWIRVGNVEFILRDCGGACSCRKRHTHYRSNTPMAAKDSGLTTCASASGVAAARQDSPCDDDDPPDGIQNDMSGVLGVRGRLPWTTSTFRLSQQAFVANLFPEGPTVHCGTRQSAGFQSARAVSTTFLPIPPLEIDFVSGPRMGEKLLFNERVVTLGRSEGNAIQVGDSSAASVSRNHCTFEYRGCRWYLRDTSTNGTWRRLSCILEPSKPMPLSQGVSILAGMHELLVEEAELPCVWLPSTVGKTLGELCDREQRARTRAQ